MASGSRSSSSSSNYHVFLSFRGEDTRLAFTGHLYKALHDKGIHTFIDDEKLQRGEEITPALMKAIQDSRVAITVLSEHYASSSFCLDELATILHCHQRKRLLVIPVFYKVDPSDVRHQKGSYGEALAKLLRNLKVLNFKECESLTEIPDVSDLPNLEELSFDGCVNLITVHHSIGFLNKLQLLNATRCRKLTTFPPLNLASLERLGLSFCSSLENFPEILGEMKNLSMLELFDLGLKELPVSFQNLVGLETLSLRDCGILLLPSNIVMMPKLSSLKATSCKGLQWVKSEEGEEKMGSIVCSNVYHFSVDGCNLYDDFFSTGFMQFDHVKTLNLRDNNFTFLPECIRELQFLTRLDVSGCYHLQEIRGVPPNLKDFKARECISLSSSSSSMLSNQELHEAGQTKFWFPGATIPEWFNHQSRGPSSSFWFRNKFPDNVLCLLLASVDGVNEYNMPMPSVFVNGELHEIPSWGTRVRKVKLDYTYLFDLNSTLYDLYYQYEVDLEKEWNHVEITYAGLLETSLVKAIGIHVFRQDDIRYDDPYGKRKFEHDLNSFESQPLIKRPRLSRWVGPERIINLLGNAADGTLITNAQRRYRQIPMVVRNASFWRRHVCMFFVIVQRLNVSGAYNPSSGTAACGGIFSDNCGRFVLGFSVKLGECWSNDEGEIWGIYHGMKIARKYDIWGLYRHILRQRSIRISPKIARQHDFGKIFVESGSEKAIGFVLDGCPTSPSPSTSTSPSTCTSLEHSFPL
ncbi:TMV resistance protein N [Glycine soja]|nr:TMV resistance protein N [Glycine soja]